MKRAWLAFVVVASTACGGNVRPGVSPALRGPGSAGGPGSIDTLDFVLGDAATWPRTGTQRQNQTVDHAKREVCWVKYGRADMFECWRWDDTWIYHEVDHAIDAGTGASYAFTDARWLPRRMTFARPWSLDVPRNMLRWWTPSCAMDAARAQRFPYRQRAWLEPARYLGDDLGIRDVLVLEYEPYDPRGPTTHPELFEFARGAGWFAWSSDRGRATFDEFGGPSVARSSACAKEGPP